MKSFRPYAIAIALFLIWITCQSCASRCGQQRRYWNNHRCVMIETKDTAQYAFANNQIVMFEKNAY